MRNVKGISIPQSLITGVKAQDNEIQRIFLLPDFVPKLFVTLFNGHGENRYSRVDGMIDFLAQSFKIELKTPCTLYQTLCLFFKKNVGCKICKDIQRWSTPWTARNHKRWWRTNLKLVVFCLLYKSRTVVADPRARRWPALLTWPNRVSSDLSLSLSLQIQLSFSLLISFLHLCFLP